VEMAGRLHLTLRQYRALEVGELHIPNDLYERIVEGVRVAALARTVSQAGRDAGGLRLRHLALDPGD
jgi:hypothetical protein